MKIGIPKEIKKHEYRVSVVPANIKAYIKQGHEVYVEKNAGLGSGFEDKEYIESGAHILNTAKEVFDKADMIIKVKEPQEEEINFFKEGQILYTYLHLASNEHLTKKLMDKKIKAVAYETMEEHGMLPCLMPMSQIAGRLSVQEAAKYIERQYGGLGVLFGGVPGVAPAKVAVLGGGSVGTNAAKIAVGMRADVSILDISLKRLTELDDLFQGKLKTLYSNQENIDKIIKESDIIIGAVLVPGAKAPHLIKKEDLKKMKKGSVIVDVAIDQGGCIETSKPTSHDDPIYTVDNVIHYCVANMPGAVARTSTLALTGITLKYGLQIASLGLEKACMQNKTIETGLNLYEGKCTYKAVADTFNIPYSKVDF